MLELEDQIRRVADAAFAATSPVEIQTPSNPKQDSRRVRLVAAAALLLLAAGVGWALVLSGPDEQGVAANGQVAQFSYLSGALSLDLDEPIAASSSERLSSLKPVLSFDLDTVPAGWSAEQTYAISTWGPGPQELPTGDRPSPTYWQQIVVRTPDRTDLVVNIQGPMEPPPEGITLTARPGEERVLVRGQAASRTNGSLSWVEQGRVVVSIIGGPRSASTAADISDDILELAQSLQPVIAELDWDGGDEMSTPAGLIRDDVKPLFAGQLGGMPWRIAPAGQALQLLLGDEARFVGGTPQTSSQDSAIIGYSIDPVAVPGGAILYGHSPQHVETVQLQLINAVVDLPAVSYGDNQTAFAVPLSDELDPIEVRFLASDGATLATIPLADLPPYLGGSIGTFITISTD